VPGHYCALYPPSATRPTNELPGPCRGRPPAPDRPDDDARRGLERAAGQRVCAIDPSNASHPAGRGDTGSEGIGAAVTVFRPLEDRLAAERTDRWGSTRIVDPTTPNRSLTAITALAVGGFLLVASLVLGMSPLLAAAKTARPVLQLSSERAAFLPLFRSASSLTAPAAPSRSTRQVRSSRLGLARCGPSALSQGSSLSQGRSSL
jgi:hypothetical protein